MLSFTASFAQRKDGLDVWVESTFCGHVCRQINELLLLICTKKMGLDFAQVIRIKSNHAVWSGQIFKFTRRMGRLITVESHQLEIENPNNV